MRRFPLCSCLLALALCSGVASAQLKISQIYGGGGNIGAPLERDYVEIHNPTGAPVSVAGWSVQYSAATASGTTAWQVTTLAGSVPAGGYFLVYEASGTAGFSPTLPTADVTGTIPMSATDGRVAICNNTTPLQGTTVTAAVVDLIGFGTATTLREPAIGGTAANNAPFLGGGVVLAEYRRGCGATDTNNNAADFVVGFPSPRNSTTPLGGAGLSGIGFSSPHVAEPTQTVKLIATPRACGTDGPDPTIVVTVNLTGLGGAAAVALNDAGLLGDEVAGDGLHSIDVVIGGAVTAGTKNIPVSYTNGPDSGGGFINMRVSAAATPNNDNCSTAIAVAVPSNTAWDFTGAQAEYNPVSSTPGFTGGIGMSTRRGLWYTVVGTGNTITATTCGPLAGSQDTIMNVMCGTCDGMTVVGSNDQMSPVCPAPSSSGNPASVSWCSTMGTTYFVAVQPFSTGAQSMIGVLDVTDNGIACSTQIPCTTCSAPSTVGATIEDERGFGPGINDGCDNTTGTFQTVAATFPQTIVGTARGYFDIRDTDWYRFQATGNGTLTATLTAQFQGIVSVHGLDPTGSCAGGVSTLGVSVSSNRCATTAASGFVVTGNWYAVRVVHAPTPSVFGGNAPGGSSYNYALDLTFGGSSTAPNDNCATPDLLAIGAGYARSTTEGANNDGTSSCDATGRDVWYSLTLSAGTFFNAPLSIDTCGSSVDTVLTLYSGTCGTLTEVACNDDCGGSPCGATSSCLQLGSLAAGTYLLRVSDKGIGLGGTIKIRAVQALTNDACPNAIPLTCGQVVTATNVGATAESPAVPTTCTGPQVPGVSQSTTVTNGVWFSVTAPANGTMYADTTGSVYDSKIWVWTGTCGSLTCVSMNDDIADVSSGFPSKVGWPATMGTTYLVMVGPFSSTLGTFSLAITCEPTPANDLCSAPQVLSPIEGGSVAGTTMGGTADLKYTSTAAYPSCAAVLPAQGGIFDVWYSYTACATGNLLLNTCGAFDTLLSVHTTCPTLTLSNQISGMCNNDGALTCPPGSELTVAVTSGTTYLIRVAGAVGRLPQGNFTLSWSATGLPVFYADGDGDGFGAGLPVSACSAPPGHVSNNADCNDSDAAINPNAAEICDGIDNDCDTLIDDADPDAPKWYQDSDTDTYGNPAVFVVACIQPVGYVANNLDCDDTNGAINPAATEVCDGGVDNNCNGLADDNDPGVIGQSAWYQDSDGDTYGNPGVSQLACIAPSGYVADNTDCNDTSSVSYPGASEICDGLDNDCDTAVDEGCPSNDSCFNATAIVDGSIVGDNSIAASEIANLTCGPVTNDVWYSYTNPLFCSWDVTASMCAADGGGAPYDAVIHVFSACGGSLVACNDNFCGSDPKVTFTLAPGASVVIAVSAVAPGPGGLFKMVVSHTSASFSTIGLGCSDGGGPGPSLTIDAPPVLGSTRTLTIAGAAPGSPGMLFMSNQGPSSPLPGGCQLYVVQGSMFLLSFIGTDGSGGWSLVANVPSLPFLECNAIAVQAAILPAGGVPFYQVTDGLGLVLGL